MSSFVFKDEVQNQFRKAGWYPGRDFSKHLNKVRNVTLLPDFLKSFLQEYGGLYVPLLHNKSTFNLNDIVKGKFNFKESLKPSVRLGRDLYLFPVGQENDEGGMIYCDGSGSVYSAGELDLLVSNDFVSGIERIIMCDYVEALEWDINAEVWTTQDLPYYRR